MAESTPNDEDRWSAAPPAAPAEAPAAAVAAPKDSPLFADTTRVSVPNVPRRERTTDIGLGGDPAGGSTKPFATYNPGGGQVSLLPPTAATRDLPASNLRNPPSRPPVAPAAGIPGEHAGLRVAPPARPVPGIGPYAATLPPSKPISHPPPPPPPPTASKPPPPPPTAVKAEAFFGRASGEFGNAGGEHTPVVNGRLTKLPPPPIEAVPAHPAAPSEPEVEAAPAAPDIASLFGEELPSDPLPPGEGLTETSAELKITDDAEAMNASDEEGSASIQVNLDAPGPDALPAPLVTAPTDDSPVADSISDDEGPTVDLDPTAPITVAPPVPVRPLSSYLPALGLVAVMLAVAFGAASIVSRWLALPSARRPTVTAVARPAPQRAAPQPPPATAICRSSASFPSLEAAVAAGYFPCRASHAAAPAFYCSIEAAPVAATRPRFCRSVRRACSSQNGSDVCLANPLAARVAHDQRGAD